MFVRIGTKILSVTNPVFSSHVHVKHGKLRGWCDHCPAHIRRRHLRASVAHDGYATTIRRLTFLKAIANRHNNMMLRTTASADIQWLQRTMGR